MTITNPGNVKNNPVNKWTGSTSEDSRGIAIFKDADGHRAQAWGVRAMVRTLAQKSANGKRSLIEIISEWAPVDDPDADNDPIEYAATVGKWIGAAVGIDLCIFGDRGEILNYDRLIKLIASIAIFENGHGYYLRPETILDGIELYLETWGPK